MTLSGMRKGLNCVMSVSRMCFESFMIMSGMRRGLNCVMNVSRVCHESFDDFEWHEKRSKLCHECVTGVS